MLETLHTHEGFCNVCSHLWTLPVVSRQSSIDNPSIGNPQSTIGNRFQTLDQLIRRCGLRRDEVATPAALGALNAFGFDRRTALWQVEQAVRPAGELFEAADDRGPTADDRTSDLGPRPSAPGAPPVPLMTSPDITL